MFGDAPRPNAAVGGTIDRVSEHPPLEADVVGDHRGRQVIIHPLASLKNHV